jgi:hypothetical protein
MPIKAVQETSNGGRNPCEMGLTFFPKDAENLPTGWSQAVQQAGGNTQPDQLMKIALAGYPIPQLYMAPVSVYTQVGGAIPAACVAGQGAAGAGVLIRPAAYTITWALAGQSGQLGPFLKGSKQDPPPNVTLNFVPQLPDVRGPAVPPGGRPGGRVPRQRGSGAPACVLPRCPCPQASQQALSFEPALGLPPLAAPPTSPLSSPPPAPAPRPSTPQGDYCLQVKMDLIANSGIVSLGAQQYEVPARGQSIMRQVCFYKLATRPQANITFHSCNRCAV